MRISALLSQVICYLRRQDLLVASGHVQAVKSMGCSTPARDLGRPLYSPDLDWDLLYSRWRMAFPHATLTFLNYDKCREQNTLLSSFKSTICETPVKTLDEVGRSNPGLDAELTEIARMLNERGQLFDLKMSRLPCRSADLALLSGFRRS